MSHHHETIICPNCNSQASGNYCSQCGQENDLHKESFWKLLVHFFGHYFHYDAKSWQTLKVLWFSPGTLTLAYWKKQRMRYLPPISLYIFISVVYFLIAFTFAKYHSTHVSNIVKTMVTDSTGTATNITIDSLHKVAGSSEPGNHFSKFIKEKTEDIASEHRMPVAKYLREKTWHTVPKMMFFMIPVLAWLLKIRFYRRAQLHFVDHAIFAFHTHSFWFSIRLFSLIDIHPVINIIVNTAFYSIFFIYMVRALMRVYEIQVVNAALTLMAITIFYLVIMTIFTIAVMAAYFLLA